MTWWNSLWEAVSVMVTLDTITEVMKVKARTPKAVCHVKMLTNQMLVLPFPQSKTWRQPLQLDVPMTASNSFLSLELKLEANQASCHLHLGSHPTSPLNFGRKGNALALVPLHNSVFKCSSFHGCVPAVYPGESRACNSIISLTTARIFIVPCFARPSRGDALTEPSLSHHCVYLQKNIFWVVPTVLCRAKN